MSITLGQLFLLNAHLTNRDSSKSLIGVRKIDNNKYYIIDLNETLLNFKNALQLIEDVIFAGGKVWFTGIPIIWRDDCEELNRLGCSFLTSRAYMPGFLTNFYDDQKKFRYLQRYSTKFREAARGILKRQYPDLVVHIKPDFNIERINRECNLLGIPMIAISDYESGVLYPIPSSSHDDLIHFYLTTIIDKIKSIDHKEKSEFANIKTK